MISIKKKTGTTGLLIIAILFVFGACTNTQKLIDNGNYDEAIGYASKKLRGKTKKKVKYVAALEEGFHKANSRDMGRLNHLRENAIARPENWEKIFTIAQTIDQRQDLISPLLPVMDKEGYKANFKFIRTASIVAEARKEAAEFLYNKAKDQLLDARAGNKLAGRKAFYNLEKLNFYQSNFKDQSRLLREARELGTTNVFLSIKNSAAVYLPTNFEAEISRIGVADMQGGWTAYHTTPKEGLNMDLRVIMNILTIDVSPERLSERAYLDQKEIENGYEYLYNEEGKPVVDSSGNHIQIPLKKIITAEVLENYQYKAAVVRGNLDFFDFNSKELLRTEPLRVETVFENYASTFRGDRRALSSDSKRRIGNAPRPFPTDEQLLLQAADLLKPIIKEKMLYHDELLVSL